MLLLAELLEYLENLLPTMLPIQHTSSTKVYETIAKELKSRKTPGYDLIDSKILKELPKKPLFFITILFNGIIRKAHISTHLKTARIILFLKPGKPPNEVSSYRPISPLPTLSKVFEKLLLKRMKVMINNEELIPQCQFGFRNKHSKIE